MRDAQAPITFYREDYTAPNYKISRTDLTFTLNPSRTKVASRLEFEVWDHSNPDNLPLELDGEDLELDQVLLNGEKLGSMVLIGAGVIVLALSLFVLGDHQVRRQIKQFQVES